MARCTATRRGHRTASGRAACPKCGGTSGRYGGFGGNNYSYSPPPSSFFASTSRNSGITRSSGGGSRNTAKPSWSGGGSSVWYTPEQVVTLTPIRESIENLAKEPDLRDVFLCHAWDDRLGAAKELHDLLESRGVKVWFSEKDVTLGGLLMRSIDRGLANSRVGIVLVTPALLRRLQSESIADKELSVLLATNRLIPIVHNTTFDALRNVSPMLASRSGLDSEEETMADIAAKIGELVSLVPTT